MDHHPACSDPNTQSALQDLLYLQHPQLFFDLHHVELQFHLTFYVRNRKLSMAGNS